MVEVIDGDALLPELPPKPQKTLGQTVKEIGKVVAFGPDELEDFPSAEELANPNWPGFEDRPDVASAFDRGATLSIPEPTATSPIIPSAATRDRPRKKNLTRKATDAVGSDQLTELFAAGLITLIAFTIGDWALPTPQESSDLARPLANIVARRVDLAAKLGKDANDTVAFAIAIMAYMVRVGPIAAERVRGWYDDRQQRTRIDRLERAPGGPSYPGGEGSMAVGEDAGRGSHNGSPYHPVDAIAQARRIGLGSLDRDFGYVPTDHSSVGG